MKETTLTELEIDIITRRLKNKEKCTSIAKELDVSIHKIYGLKEKLGLNIKQNKVFDFTPIQEQIFLSGRLGDGNFKKNGLYNYIYRESHSELELDYLRQKSFILGECISERGIKSIPKKGFNINTMYDFSTITTPSLIPYAKYSIEETIRKLDKYGLCLFFLDDGWIGTNKTFYISRGELNDSQIDKLVEQYNNSGFIGVRKQNTRKDITIPYSNYEYMFNTITEIIPKDTDIIRKKFKLA